MSPPTTHTSQALLVQRGYASPYDEYQGYDDAPLEEHPLPGTAEAVASPPVVRQSEETVARPPVVQHPLPVIAETVERPPVVRQCEEDRIRITCHVCGSTDLKFQFVICGALLGDI